MIAWFAIAICLVLGLRWAGYQFGWWARVGAWLAVRLEYEETTRDALASELWSQPYEPGPKEPEKRPLKLRRLRPGRDAVTLSFSHPVLRRRWRQ